METETKLRIDPRAIPDEALARFRKLAVETVVPLAPRFGEWLTLWLDAEQFHRQRDPEHRKASHLRALPMCDDWTDEEIGQSLRAVTALSMILMDGSLNEFLDRLVLAIGEVAATRLGSRHA